MSYEQLLELGDRIGYVSTGLKEEDMSKCLRKIKQSLSNNVPLVMEGKCSICQEEYDGDDEVGKLYCGHNYHLDCIKQWLVQKKTCPVCKTEATA